MLSVFIIPSFQTSANCLTSSVYFMKAKCAVHTFGFLVEWLISAFGLHWYTGTYYIISGWSELLIKYVTELSVSNTWMLLVRWCHTLEWYFSGSDYVVYIWSAEAMKNWENMLALVCWACWSIGWPECSLVLEWEPAHHVLMNIDVHLPSRFLNQQSALL